METPRKDGPDRRRFRTDLDTYRWRTDRLVIGVIDGKAGGPFDLSKVIGSTAVDFGLISEPVA